MNFLGILTQIFLYLTGIVLFFWVARYIFIMYYNAKQLEAINKLEAKVAVLRMLLKAKIKKKSNAVSSQLSKEKVLLEEVKPKFDTACGLNFTKPYEFQTLLNLMKEISVQLDSHFERRTREANPNAAHAEEEKQRKEELERKQKGMPALDEETKVWLKVLKHEKANIYIVKEIVDTTQELKNKIEIYNVEIESAKKRLRVPELIKVDSFDLICKLVEEDKVKTSEASVEAPLIAPKAAA